MNRSVDNYFLDGCGRCELGGTPECKVRPWTDVLLELRRILNETELVEECKWGVPCYTIDGKNVLILSALKDWVTIGFFKGVLLKDELKLLVSPGRNSQADRQFRFTEMDQVRENEFHLKAYVTEAIELERSGARVSFKKDPEPIPEELQEKFEEDAAFREAFAALTPGRKRGYIIYISQAKQMKTRRARVEKCMPKIFAGKGMHDR